MTHQHDFPQLPQKYSTGPRGFPGYLCPAMLPDGRICRSSLTFARSVRSFHHVRGWTAQELTLSPAVGVDVAEDDDAHLWCTAGHDWAVPPKVEFE